MTLSAETDLYATLIADPSVMSYVEITDGGSPSHGRIYPEWVKEKTPLPAIAYFRQNTEFHQTIHGSAVLGETVDFEITCIATTRTEADALADAAQNALTAAGYVLNGRTVQTDFDPELWATALFVLKNSTS